MTTPLPTRATVERADGLAEIQTEDGVILLALDAPHCNPFELTGGGILVWEQLAEGPREARSVIEAIARATDAPPATIEPSVLVFLAELVELGLVRLSSRY